MKQVQETSTVEFEFTLSLLDGTLVEQTQAGETFKLTIGDGQFISQLDSLLVGLEVGTTAKYMLSAQDAYGNASPDNLQTMPKTNFPDDMELKKGNVLGFDLPTGEEIPGTIHLIEEDSVVVDFNHPLAGQGIVFEVKIIKIG